MKKFAMRATAVVLAGVLSTPVLAQGMMGQNGMGPGQGMGQRMGPGMGPVALRCQKDIEALCADERHGRGGVRDCLEANKSKVSDDCRAALDSTGGGRR